MNDQRDTIDKSIAAIEALAVQATAVYRMMHLLVYDLESKFDLRRARESNDDTTIWCFSNESVDTMLWLMGELHHASSQLREAVFVEQGRLNDLFEGATA